MRIFSKVIPVKTGSTVNWPLCDGPPLPGPLLPRRRGSLRSGTRRPAGTRTDGARQLSRAGVWGVADHLDIRHRDESLVHHPFEHGQELLDLRGHVDDADHDWQIRGCHEVPTMDDSIDRFIKEAVVANVALTFANHPQGVHGFDNQNNDDRSREIIRTALEFMKAHLETASTVSQSSAQTPAEQEVLQFERDACKAFLDADKAALEQVLTPDFTLTLSNGDVSTRADEINELRGGKVHYDAFENYDMLARLYGNDTAVVLGKTRVKGTSDGKPFDRVVQFTDTLIKRDGRWQLVAGHVSRTEK